jgi:TetR/AcrR family transcriptional regulator, tetracycline repressor protein
MANFAIVAFIGLDSNSARIDWNEARMTASVRRAYGELDRAQVVSSLRDLARRVGVQQVTMRELAAELGAAVPSVYYHVPGKQAALDLLAESVLAGIPVPAAGPWDVRLAELYCSARDMMLDVPGLAGVLQASGGGESARRLDRLSRTLLAEAGLVKAVAAAAHSVLYTYLLGSVSLAESRGKRQSTRRFRAGLDVIIAGIKASEGER